MTSGAAALLAAVLLLAGCGDDEPDVTIQTAPPVTTPAPTTVVDPTVTESTPAQTGQATTPAPQPTTQAAARTATDDTTVGDERRPRVPARFEITGDGAGLRPKAVTVPAFFPIEISALARGRAATISVRLPGRTLTLDVPAGGRAALRPQLLPAGRHSVTTSGGGQATLVVTEDIAEAVGP